MKIKSFAPGKVILFGEHSVVHNRPAIAMAIDKGVDVELNSRDDDIININIPVINYSEKLFLLNNVIDYNHIHNNMITDYVFEVISLFKFDKGFDLEVNINMPLGVGLGSSAAVTVSCMKAISLYANEDYDLETIAQKSRNIEITIQGAASPIDTSMSTYGGIIYINRQSKLSRIDFDMQLPIIISDCNIEANTGKLVESVRLKYVEYSEIMTNIFDAMGLIADNAKVALEEGNSQSLANLMNLNQGLLDSIGVNTFELSDMVFTARKFGALGSKLTGSGGGGCIIAYAPNNTEEILQQLNLKYKAFKCEESKKGVQAQIIE